MDIIPPSTFISINFTNACKVLTTVQHTNESSKLLENINKEKKNPEFCSKITFYSAAHQKLYTYIYIYI